MCGALFPEVAAQTSMDEMRRQWDELRNVPFDGIAMDAGVGTSLRLRAVALATIQRSKKESRDCGRKSLNQSCPRRRRLRRCQIPTMLRAMANERSNVDCVETGRDERMTRRLFTFAAAISFLMWGVSLFLWARSDGRRDKIPFLWRGQDYALASERGFRIGAITSPAFKSSRSTSGGPLKSRRPPFWPTKAGAMDQNP